MTVVHHPAPATTRRVFLGAAACLPLVAAAACSSASPETAAPTPSAAGTVFPVVVDHVYGSTTIERAPTRIVTLGLSDQDPLLALGVAPIAVSEWYGGYDHATWPWASDELGDAKPVVLNKGTRDEANPPVEEIAALGPDLIISLYNGTTREQYDQLSKLAPVVVPTKAYADFAITWQEATRVTGQALGREAEATALVTDLEKKFASAAADHPSFAGLNVVVGERFEAGETVVRAGNDVRAKFFEQLGFVLPTEIGGKKPDEYGEIAVSDEVMDKLSRDVLVWNVGFAPEVRKDIEASSVYAKLPVVAAGKVLWVADPVVSGAFSWGTILSLEYALDQLLPQIAATVG